MSINDGSDILQLASQKQLSECTGQDVAIIVFGAPWCHPCQVQWPFLYRVAEQSPQPVTLAQVDAEEYESLAKSYQIEGLPTILLFHQGVLFRRFIGVQTTEEILTAISENQGRQDR